MKTRSVKEVSEALKVHRTTISRLCKKHLIKCHKGNNGYRIYDSNKTVLDAIKRHDKSKINYKDLYNKILIENKTITEISDFKSNLINELVEKVKTYENEKQSFKQDVLNMHKFVTKLENRNGFLRFIILIITTICATLIIKFFV